MKKILSIVLTAIMISQLSLSIWATSQFEFNKVVSLSGYTNINSFSEGLAAAKKTVNGDILTKQGKKQSPANTDRRMVSPKDLRRYITERKSLFTAAANGAS